mgnify:CR=1 FL=1
MRKTFLSIAALIAVAISNGQTGTILVGGNASFSKTKNTRSADGYPYYYTKETTLAINPFVGYQFDENWTAGATGTINFSEENYNTYKSKNKFYGVGPFVRYTHHLSDVFFLFGQLEGQYKSTVVGDVKGVSTKLFPAIFINVKNGFGLNFDFGGIEYEASNYKDAPCDLRSSSFGLNFGKTFNIGISKNF